MPDKFTVNVVAFVINEERKSCEAAHIDPFCSIKGDSIEELREKMDAYLISRTFVNDDGETYYEPEFEHPVLVKELEVLRDNFGYLVVCRSNGYTYVDEYTFFWPNPFMDRLFRDQRLG